MDYRYVISEINVTIANLERLKRGLEQEAGAAAGTPSEIEYNRDLLDGPPKAVEPKTGEVRCNCGLPAEFKKSAPQNPKQWAAYFCARPKSDPKNCGFRKWLD
jgi:hypothetical protein